MVYIMSVLDDPVPPIITPGAGCVVAAWISEVLPGCGPQTLHNLADHVQVLDICPVSFWISSLLVVSFEPLRAPDAHIALLYL